MNPRYLSGNGNWFFLPNLHSRAEPMAEGGTVNPLWRRLNDQTQEGYDLLVQRPGGVYVSESPDYHAHDAWGIVHLHKDGTVPHVHKMEIRPGKFILFLDAQLGLAEGGTVNVPAETIWQFNEAVSLLREARVYLPEATGLAEEIDEVLPAIQAALEAAAHAQSGRSDG